MAGAVAFFYRARRLDGKTSFLIVLILALFIYFKISLIYISPLLAWGFIQVLYIPGPGTGFGKYGDCSYGMYIYAFPVQQLFSSLYPNQMWWENLGASFPVTLLLAIFSWKLVEKPCLALKNRRALLPAAKSSSLENN